MKKYAFLGGLCAVCLTGAMSASANLLLPNGTYEFTETDGNNYCTGSTVTFLNDVLVSWNIIDTESESVPYTPGNSTYIGTPYYEYGVFATDEWAYSIEALNADQYGDPHTEIGNISGVGYVYDQPSYTDPLQDPSGIWTLLPTPSPAVPDVYGTSQLLSVMILGMGALRRKLR